MMLAMKLDERGRKILLVLCALLILILLIFGALYLCISKYMEKQGKKMDTYMYDLLSLGIVTKKSEFKAALRYFERRNVYNSTKWAFRALIVLFIIAFSLIYTLFDKDINGFFTKAFDLIPIIKWPTVKEVNEAINNDSLKLSGPGWLPASLIPTIISKNPDFSSPLLYCSTIFYVCALICLFKLIASTLAFIARYRRGIKMSTEVFLKDLSKLDLYNKNINSPITSSTSVTKDNNTNV
ncbi:MAG: hypothetical protein MR270_00100 [Erysipelotrichaceae bacterium]|nr:hypothetical protein [Erysipelotrichaceae bacterium]